MLGIKQGALAIDLGLSQQAFSHLEQKEILDAPMLGKVAKILGLTEEAIKPFNEKAAINIISSTIHETSITGTNNHFNFTFKPIE